MATLLVDDEQITFLVRLTKSDNPTLRAQAYAELLKVGPKGYEHGWIFVGAPGVGALVHHPTHGHGRVARAGKKTSEVHFASGHKAAFEHSAAGPSDMHFVARAAVNAGKKRPVTNAEHRLAADAQVQTDHMGPSAPSVPAERPVPAGGHDATIQAAARRYQAGEISSEELARTMTEQGRLNQEAQDRAAGRGGETVYRPAGEAGHLEQVVVPPGKDRKIADAEARVKVTEQRLARAQAKFDAAGRDPKVDALGEHFPLGTGGSGGGRRGSTDAQLRRYVEARQARDAAQSQHIRAQGRLKELTARQNAAGKYSRGTVSAGDAIKVDGTWYRVQKANDKTVQVDLGPGMDVKYRWDRVTDHRPAKPKVETPAAPPVAVPEPDQRAAEIGAEKDRRRASSFAGKWIADVVREGRTDEPTDENLAAAFANTAKPPPRSLYGQIRDEIKRQTAELRAGAPAAAEPDRVSTDGGLTSRRVVSWKDRLAEDAQYNMPATRSSRPVQAGDRVKHGFQYGEVLRLERKRGIDGAVVTTEGEQKYPNWVPLAQIHVKPTEEDAQKLAGEAVKVREQQAQAAAQRATQEAAAEAARARQEAARTALAGTPALQLRSRGRKGDLAILETEGSSFTQGRGHERQKQFELVRVAGTNRDGVPTSYHYLSYGDPKPGDRPVKVPSGSARQHTFHVIPPGSVNEQGAIEAARANSWHPDRPNESHQAGKPFESLDEARVALAPHVTPTAVLASAGPVKAKPAGRDWEKVPSLIPKPRRGSGGLAPKAPAEVNYVEPTGLAPGAKVAWTHHHENGSTTQRTGRVWDAAPGTNSAWVIPDEKLPSDPYSALVIQPERRGGTKFVSHDSTSHTTGSLAAAAARVAHEHKYGPTPKRLSQHEIETYIKDATETHGLPSLAGPERLATDPRLQGIVRGFSPYGSAENRIDHEEAVRRLREGAAHFQNQLDEAKARSLGRHDDRLATWEGKTKLYTEIADRIEAEWKKRVAEARAKGSMNKGALSLDMILRAAEHLWWAQNTLTKTAA